MGRVVLLAGIWAAVTSTLLQQGPMTVVGETLPKEPATGARDERVKSRIVGGYFPHEREFPYQAGIAKADPHIFGKQKREVLCSGALIGVQWVLTAATCTTHRAQNDLQVILGTITFDDETLSQFNKQFVDIVVRHPKYTGIPIPPLNKWDRERAPAHDIALLHLPHAVELSSKVQLVNWAHKGDSIENFTYGNVTGWGDVAHGVPGPANKNLKVGRMKIGGWSNRDPVWSVHAQFQTEGYNLTAKNSVPCVRDKGAPLVANWTVYGIASWIPEDCKGGQKTIFTNVAFYDPWLTWVVLNPHGPAPEGHT